MKDSNPDGVGPTGVIGKLLKRKKSAGKVRMAQFGCKQKNKEKKTHVFSQHPCKCIFKNASRLYLLISTQNCFITYQRWYSSGWQIQVFSGKKNFCIAYLSEMGVLRPQSLLHFVTTILCNKLRLIISHFYMNFSLFLDYSYLSM